ncbi:MAG: hypothetical protein HYZ50_00270 [Deltaproteobacteria bacterium]|nr:hypothetical protein [Deltaproteobacteria bacterium]
MQVAKQEQIDTLLESLSREELLTLLEKIAQRLRQAAEHPPQVLYGIWKGKFPEEANIDDALQEIRSQWREEIKESNT